MFRNLTACASLAFAAAVLVSPVLAQAPSYHAEFLGAGTSVSAMNDAGVVVGTGTLLSKYPRAFVAGPGKPTSFLPLPMGFLSSGARDVNEAGVIVGVISPYQTTAFYPQPARWDADGAGGWTVTRLDTLPGDNRGTADAINDLGEIVGTSSWQSSIKTVLYAPGGAVELPGLQGYRPWSLNDAGVFVGAGPWRANIHTQTVEMLPVPAGASAVRGWVINGPGQVAGEAAGAGCDEAALWTEGSGWLSLSTCGAGNTSFDLNDGGDVLFLQDYAPHIRFASGDTWRVEDLIVAPAGHWTPDFNVDMALDSAGRMAFHATNGGQTGILLITPDAMPGCQADLGYAGPGSMHLAMCGGDLSSGTTADISLSGAKPLAIAWMVVGAASLPTGFKGGTLVPVPVALALPLAVDPAGHAELPGVAGGIGPLSVYLQCVQPDASQPKGWAISNALRADFLP